MAQSWTDWEAIVVDDASPDGESIRQVVTKFSDPRIHLVRHENNLGLAASRNTGAKQGRGEFLLFLDADDQLADDALPALLNALVADKTAEVAFGDIERFGTTSYLAKRKTAPLSDLLSLSRHWLPGAGPLMRRQVWERINGYCEAPELRRGNEDLDFWAGNVRFQVKARHVDQTTYLYRRYDGSMVVTLQRDIHRTCRFIYQRHKIVFDQYAAGHTFLAEGYAAAARWHCTNGHRLKALGLAVLGLRHQPLDHNLWKWVRRAVYGNASRHQSLPPEKEKVSRS